MDLIKLISEIINKSNRDARNIKIADTKTYTNISFFGFAYIRVKTGPKTKYFAIPSHLNYLLSLYNISATEYNSWFRINLDDSDDIYKLSGLILEIFDYCNAKSSGETFGCCSRYMECSDAKACVNDFEHWSKGCIYRRNLINGRIFYRKNATL